jgi:hypothetical protein
MKPNRQIQRLLAQGFMQERELEGPEPHGYQRDLGWEVAMDAMGELTRRLRKNLSPTLSGEVAELFGVLAIATLAAELTLADAVERATRRETLELMQAKVESYNDRSGGKLVKFPSKR